MSKIFWVNLEAFDAMILLVRRWVSPARRQGALVVTWILACCSSYSITKGGVLDIGGGAVGSERNIGRGGVQCIPPRDVHMGTSPFLDMLWDYTCG